MTFHSTRGQCPPLDFATAVATGLAPDGGLYVPGNLPDLSTDLAQWSGLSYPQLCEAFLSHFATGLDRSQLSGLVHRSFERFTHRDIAPVVRLAPNLHVLELFHGPTLAFKDFALQLLGNLYEAQIARTGQPLNVLGATSGDTGSAAIHGLLEKAGLSIFILYPRGRISPLQERQMTTTAAANVYPLAVDGSFDDAQRVVKSLFGDAQTKARFHLSAINSINIARILAQCVYYIWAYLRMPPEACDNLEFVVPTGNFGNVLAGWMTQQMGLPVKSFRVAVNQNDILHRFFTTGDYTLEPVRPSHAPSMDIQVASNFERFLYYLYNGDTARVRDTMEAFTHKRGFVFDDFDRSTFTSSATDDAGILRRIREVHERYHYLADPHTACGFNVPDDGRNRCILATAHPAKFPDIIERATGIHPTAPSLEAIKELPIVNYPLPATDDAVRSFIIEHAKAAPETAGAPR